MIDGLAILSYMPSQDIKLLAHTLVTTEVTQTNLMTIKKCLLLCVLCEIRRDPSGGLSNNADDK